MKQINLKSKEIFFQLLEKLNGNQAVKLGEDDRGFMPLHIERIEENANIAGGVFTTYSFAHYFRQNGDSVQDPDILFAVNKERNLIYPVYYQDQYNFSEALFLIGDSWKMNTRIMKDLVSFSNVWMKNLKFQQL